MRSLISAPLDRLGVNGGQPLTPRSRACRGTRGVLLILAVLAAGCATTPCDPATCNGCCLSGQCGTGAEDTACGLGGGSCGDCTSAERVCQSGACVVDPALLGRDCAHPQAISLNGNQATILSDTTAAGERGGASCGGAGAPERVFQLVTLDVATLQLEVRPSSGLKPVLSLRSVCGAPQETTPGCITAAATGEGAALTVRDLPAGSWTITVGGADGTSGAFTLGVFRQSGGGETCTAPLPLNFPFGLATTLRGSLAAAGADFSLSCGSSGPDLAYAFATGASFNLDVAVTTSEPAMQPVTALKGICASGDLACGRAPSPGGESHMQALELVAGSHILVVDSVTPTGGEFELRASLSTPPLGASCINPQRLVLDAGFVHVDADTERVDGGFPVGAAGSCGGTASGERVYRFVTTQLSNLKATVTPDGGQTPLLYLRRANCGGTERACKVGPRLGEPVTLEVGNLPADTWFLFVDGLTQTAGGFGLDLSLTPPIPGDACQSAEGLSFDSAGMARVQGSTRGLYDDQRLSCDTGPAPDRVYTFTATQLSSLAATVSPLDDGGYWPGLSLRQGTCLSSYERACKVAPSAGSGAFITAGSLQPGTYQLWVDGAGGTSGDFDLVVRLFTPPPGESCGNAQPLFEDGGLSETVSATLQGYAHDTGGSCGGAPSGSDRAYTFDTSETMNLRATLTTAAGETGVLYLRSYSCTSGDRGCALGAGTVQLEVPNLPIATHTLWVDSVGADAGAFTLTATLIRPEPGDQCSAPRFLSFVANADGGMTATETGDTRNLFDNTSACSGNGGADEVFLFTTTAPAVVTATVMPLASNFWPTVSVRSFCSSLSSTACSSAPASGAPASFTVNTLPAGIWYLWVDGAQASRGAYTLRVDLN
jgi:hypothetical protein